MLSTNQITIGSLLFVTFSITVYYITKQKQEKNKEEDKEESKKED
tara:strand:+ start:303 stop:437 length:135 start_codon:yes stop_codon:yes gene_type:complete